MTESYGLCLRIHTAPGSALLRRVLELATDLNARWYIEEWAARRRPPTSCREAGVRYRPDAPATRSAIATVPIVLADGVASCGSVAAVSAGHARALDVARGLGWEEAARRHGVVLVPRGRRYWHAVVRAPTGFFDPTKGMKPWG